jgi:hypothetical protein
MQHRLGTHRLGTRHRVFVSLQRWMAPAEVDGTATGGWHRNRWVAPAEVDGTGRGGWHRQRWVAPAEVGGTAKVGGTGRRFACTRCRAIRPTLRNRIFGAMAEWSGWHLNAGAELGARHYVDIPRWVAPGRGGWHPGAYRTGLRSPDCQRSGPALRQSPKAQAGSQPGRERVVNEPCGTTPFAEGISRLSAGHRRRGERVRSRDEALETLAATNDRPERFLLQTKGKWRSFQQTQRTLHQHLS